MSPDSSSKQTPKRLLGRIGGLLRSRMARDVGLLTVSRYVSAGIRLVTAVVAARVIGPAEFGTAAIVIGYATLLHSFASVKSISATLRYISTFRATGRIDHLRAICKVGYAVDAGAAFVAFLVVAATAGWATSEVLHVPGTASLAVVYAASNVFDALSGTGFSILAAMRRFGWQALWQILDAFVTFLSIMGFLLAGFEASGVVLGWALAQVVNGVILVLMANLALAREGIASWWKARLSVLRGMGKELFRFFSWSSVWTTLSGVLNTLPLLLLGNAGSKEAAGFFRLALNVQAPTGLLEGAIRRVTYPRMSEQWARGELAALEASIVRWTVKGSLPLGILLLATVLLFPVLIPLVFGPSYRAMVGGTQVLMIGSCVSLILFFMIPFFYASGRISYATKIYAAFVLYVTVAGWLAIDSWGFIGLCAVIGLGEAAYKLVLASLAWRTLRRARREGPQPVPRPQPPPADAAVGDDALRDGL